MKFRPATYTDREWLVECWADWPDDYLGPQRVHNLIKRWVKRGDFKCLIAETDHPVGFVIYKVGHPFGFNAVIYNLVVHPNDRNQGHSKTMRRLLKDKLTAEGVVVARFNTLPGPFRGLYPDDTVTLETEI